MSKIRKINPDTAHRWANQIGDYSETRGGHLFFRGDTIYSYGDHFPIARHVKHPSVVGVTCVLFTTRTYSVTTRGHCYEVEGAIPGHLTVFHVDNVRAEGSAEHIHNLHDYRDRITTLAGRAKRARSNKHWYIKKLDDLLKERNGYIDFFQLDAQHIEPNDEVVEQFAKVAELARKEEREREKERERQAEIKNQEDIEKWKAGEINHFPFSVQRVYLRKGPGAVVTTSKGAIVPYAHALLAFRIAERCHNQLQDFQPNGKTLHVGHYQIDHIDTYGNVRADCHQIYWEQIEEFAKKEGWLETANVAT